MPICSETATKNSMELPIFFVIRRLRCAETRTGRSFWAIEEMISGVRDKQNAKILPVSAAPKALKTQRFTGFLTCFLPDFLATVLASFLAAGFVAGFAGGLAAGFCAV